MVLHRVMAHNYILAKEPVSCNTHGYMLYIGASPGRQRVEQGWLLFAGTQERKLVDAPTASNDINPLASKCALALHREKQILACP